jgi:hypothetical protein
MGFKLVKLFIEIVDKICTSDIKYKCFILIRYFTILFLQLYAEYHSKHLEKLGPIVIVVVW